MTVPGHCLSVTATTATSAVALTGLPVTARGASSRVSQPGAATSRTGGAAPAVAERATPEAPVQLAGRVPAQRGPRRAASTAPNLPTATSRPALRTQPGDVAARTGSTVRTAGGRSAAPAGRAKGSVRPGRTTAPGAPAVEPGYRTYASFASYVKERGPVLLRTARSLTANVNDAEDLLQTALTKTYVAWERIEDHRALDGYVRRALVNTRTSQWRKRKVDEFVCEELPEPAISPVQDPAEQQAVRDAMWCAIMKLPDRQRAMVVLRYYEDLSEVRTAELLGVSVGTVKSAVSRALCKLREDPELRQGV